MKGCPPDVVGGVDVGAAYEQILDDIALAVSDRQVQRFPAQGVASADIRLPLDEQLDDVSMACACCDVQERFAISVAYVDTRVLKSCLDVLRVPVANRLESGCVVCAHNPGEEHSEETQDTKLSHALDCTLRSFAAALATA
jgi:hypothetical protein